VSVHFDASVTCPVCGRRTDGYGTCSCISRRLPPLDAPEPGTVCPVCKEPQVIEGFCGACEEKGRSIWPGLKEW